MHVLVIGGLGFIGHALCARLTSHGHDVTIIDSINDYGILDRAELSRLVDLRLKEIEPSNAMHYHMDINRRQDVATIINGLDYDVCVFLAAYPRMRAVVLNPALAQETMVTSLHNILGVVRSQAKKFMYVSSSMVYGSSQEPLTESSLLQPKTLYGKLKLAGELATQMMVEDHVIIRPTGVYGPLDVTDRVMSRMMGAALANQPIIVNGHDTVMDLTYIDDTVSGMMLALHANGIFNISSGQAITLFDLASHVKQACSSDSDITVMPHDADYPTHKILDHSKATNQLGYLPRHDLSMGLEIYRSWFNCENRSVPCNALQG